MRKIDYRVMKGLSDAVVITIIGVVSSAIGWITNTFYKEYKSRKIEQKKKNYLNGLRAIANVYSCMDDLRDSGPIQRVFLLEISNGGHAPKPGSLMYAKAVEVRLEDYSRRDEILNKYTKVRLDESYISMCVEIQSTGRPYIFDVEKHEQCLLKDFYKNEGVVYSEVYHIYTDTDQEKMFILSIATYNEGEKFEIDSVRAFINTEIMQIRRYFEDYR